MSAAARIVFGVGLVALAAGCSRDEPTPPAALADGSRARPPPVSLEGVERPVLTRVRVVRSDEIRADSRTARCLDGRGGDVVERVSVLGASVTWVGAGRRELYGCDADEHATSARSAWCGRAYARLHEGRLRDPRLSVTCRGRDGAPLGFAWIQPAAGGAAYVVVEQDGYDEVYPAADGTPIRVTTDDVDLEDASVELAVAEHSQDGRRLRAYLLDARVSG
jgi:hypothetical protein